MNEAKTAVITGASKGMGKTLAKKFYGAGYNLLVCARNETDLNALSEELKFSGTPNSVSYYTADLGDKSQAIEFGNWVLKQGCKVNVLINNAGQFLPGSIYNEKDGIFEQMLAVNLSSAYHVTRVLLPGMMLEKSGHIFNICSIASLNAYPNGGSYSISKFALMGFSKNLREELKPYNIKVTAVYPGAVFTASWEGSGVEPGRIMIPSDIVEMIFSASHLSPQACVEEIVIRPQKGDIL
ncbi:MAG: SDR family oxidoreductase [Ginsengibacter sp.]